MHIEIKNLKFLMLVAGIWLANEIDWKYSLLIAVLGCVIYYFYEKCETAAQLKARNAKRMDKISKRLSAKRDDYLKAVMLAEYLHAEMEGDEFENILDQFVEIPEALEELDREFQDAKDNLCGEENALKLKEISKGILAAIKSRLRFESSAIMQRRINDIFDFNARLENIKDAIEKIEELAKAYLVYKDFEDRIDELDSKISDFCEETDQENWDDQEPTYDEIVVDLNELKDDIIQFVNDSQDDFICIERRFKSIPHFIAYLKSREETGELHAYFVTAQQCLIEAQSAYQLNEYTLEGINLELKSIRDDLYTACLEHS